MTPTPQRNRPAPRATALTAVLVTLATMGCQPETSKAPEVQPATSQEAPNAVPAPPPPEPARPQEATKATNTPTKPVAPEAAVGQVDKAEFERLLTDLESCEVGSRGIDPSCEALKRFTTGLRQRGHIDEPWHQVDRRLGHKHLLHEDPAVRLQASLLLGPLQTPSEEALEPIIAAARIEVHPGVVQHFIKRLGRGAYLHKSARQLMLEFAGHESETVRLAVTDWLTDPRARAIPEAIERAMLLAQEDDSARVRQRALNQLGNSGDDRVIPLLERILKTSKAHSRRRAAAFRALLTLWSAPVPQSNPSQRAYAVSMKWLQKTPRDLNNPPGTALSALRWSSHRLFKERAPWFDLESFAEVTFQVLSDLKTSPQARMHLADAMTHHAVPIGRWQKLREVYGPLEGLSPAELRVVKQLDEIVARGGKPRGPTKVDGSVIRTQKP